MKILSFIPHLNITPAGVTIYTGYKNAFTKLGHEYKFMTAADNQEKIYKEYIPDILFTSFNKYILKYLDLDLLKNQKNNGMKVFVNTPFWTSPLDNRINESASLSKNTEYINLIKSGDFGDVYYNISEPEDLRMKGFEKATGYKHITMPLAVDSQINFYEYDEKFKADISYIGTNLPGKREFFKQNVFPLKSKYDVKLYGQDWTLIDKTKNFARKVSQYFNIPYIKNIHKLPLMLEDERKIYSSSTISINVHEDYQKKYGSDCNERTFKIPACGGFEITDDVACIRKYFKAGKEIVIAENRDDWFDKVHYYLKYPEKREKIVDLGRKRVLKDHTYYNRVDSFVKIYDRLE